MPKVLRLSLLLLCACAVLSAPALAAPGRGAPKPVPSLTPLETQKAWRTLVQRPRTFAFSTSETCRPLRAVFYAGTDWLRLATKLAASASPCAQYYISVPPLVGDKTQPRADQAWRIRALGPNFHALAEINMTAWSSWVSTTGRSWNDAGVEARRRMAAAGYDVSLGDSWAVNEFSSAVRRGDGMARTNARALVRGLFTGDGATPSVRGAVFIAGMGQATTELSVYQARLQDWLEDGPFWSDMNAYVSDWSQELYGDFRNYAVPGAALSARRDALDDYLQHELALARVGPAAASTARSFLEGAYSPLANAAWQYDAAFGWTFVPVEEMKHYVSAQTYALRHFSAAAAQDHAGFAWAPRNGTALTATDFAAQTAQLLDRLAVAIRDSARPVDPADPGIGACGPLGQNLWCAANSDAGWFNAGWQSFEVWKPSVLAFTTAPQALTAGSASAPLTIELRTSTGIALTASSPLGVTLGSSSGGGAFSTSATGPWTASLTTTIPAGSSTTSFYYRDTKAGTATLDAAAAGKQAGTQAATVSAAALASVAVSPRSATVQPGASQTFAATGADAYGNAVAVDGATWSLAAGTPGTLAPASGRSTVFTAGSSTGSGSVVATVTTATGTFSGSAAVSVAAPATATARVSVTYAMSGKSLLVTLSLVDGVGKPLPGVSVASRIARNGQTYATQSGTTDSTGRLTTSLWKPGAGCYSTTVTSVGAPGWDGTTPPNQFCR